MFYSPYCRVYQHLQGKLIASTCSSPILFAKVVVKRDSSTSYPVVKEIMAGKPYLKAFTSLRQTSSMDLWCPAMAVVELTRIF